MHGRHLPRDLLTQLGGPRVQDLPAKQNTEYTLATDHWKQEKKEYISDAWERKGNYNPKCTNKMKKLIQAVFEIDAQCK